MSQRVWRQKRICRIYQHLAAVRLKETKVSRPLYSLLEYVLNSLGHPSFDVKQNIDEAVVLGYIQNSIVLTETDWISASKRF